MKKHPHASSKHPYHSNTTHKKNGQTKTDSQVTTNEYSVGLYLCFFTVVFTATYIAFLFTVGTHVRTIDGLDILFEAGSVLVALLMFIMISFFKVYLHIKVPLLSGLFCIILGRTTDCLDELITITIEHWSAIGDGVALVGEILVVYAATRWILEAHYMSMTDKLTQLYNRHYLEQAFERMIFFKGRAGPKLALIMLDIDDFKSINDRYGHGIGDDVLKIIAGILGRNTRENDIVARLGGEEFEILLPNTDLDTALIFAERIRSALEKHEQKLVPRVTASIGVTVFQDGDSIKSLRLRADTAVYKAKRNGKNRIEVSQDSNASEDQEDSTPPPLHHSQNTSIEFNKTELV
ncbi:MAG: GGDEF domain-containing protein [Agarilytica sp.]